MRSTLTGESAEAEPVDRRLEPIAARKAERGRCCDLFNRGATPARPILGKRGALNRPGDYGSSNRRGVVSFGLPL